MITIRKNKKNIFILYIIEDIYFKKSLIFKVYLEKFLKVDSFWKKLSDLVILF